MNIFRRIQKWFNQSTQNYGLVDHRMERYLAQSTDNADLEYRLKKWQYMSEYEKSLY